MLPVLRLIGDGCRTIPHCLPRLAEHFRLPPEEVEELLPSGRQTVLANRAHWARHYMYQAGLVRQIRRGHYEFMPEGASLLASCPDRIDRETLRSYPAFHEWIERSQTDAKPEREPASPPGSEPVATDETTPEERIASDVARIEAALGDELLEAGEACTRCSSRS